MRSVRSQPSPPSVVPDRAGWRLRWEPVLITWRDLCAGRLSGLAAGRGRFLSGRPACEALRTPGGSVAEQASGPWAQPSQLHRARGDHRSGRERSGGTVPRQVSVRQDDDGDQHREDRSSGDTASQPAHLARTGSARQSASSGVITFEVDWRALAGVRPLARLRPRRPLRRSAGFRSSRPAWTASPRIVISSDRADDATDTA
jgi:hypothetical protein